MIITRILDHDLHRARSSGSNIFVPFLHTPALPAFLPAIVSGSRGKFIVTRMLHAAGDDRYLKPLAGDPFIKNRGKVVAVNPDLSKTQLYLVSGVFDYDSEKMDDLLGDLFGAAFDLCFSDGMDNIFEGKDCVDRAFAHVQRCAGMKVQPHVCLVPSKWDKDRLVSVFGGRLDERTGKFRDHCRVIGCSVQSPVFLSRSDMVGLYTQFMGGGASIFLHNLSRGLSFFLPEEV